MSVTPSAGTQTAMTNVFRSMVHSRISEMYGQLHNVAHVPKATLLKVADWMIAQTDDLTVSVHFTFHDDKAGEMGNLLSALLHGQPGNDLYQINKEWGTPMPSITTGGGFISIGAVGTSAVDVMLGKVTNTKHICVCDVIPPPTTRVCLSDILTSTTAKAPGAIAPASEEVVLRSAVIAHA